MSEPNQLERYIGYIFEQKAKENKYVLAMLKRASHEKTRHYSWEILSKFVNLEYRDKVEAFGIIGASIANSKQKKNGDNNIGKELANIYRSEKSPQTEMNSAAAIKIRRLISCRTIMDINNSIRPVLHLISSSKEQANLDYVATLKDLVYFEFSRDQIVSRWAEGFYSSYHSVPDKASK